MGPDLSIIIPTIRIESWEPLIESIADSCWRNSHEIIFVGPSYNNYIDKFKNIKYARDFGSPNRCQQIGMTLAEGEYVTWGSDDCLYEPHAIDECLNIARENDECIIVTNYDEGGNVAVEDFSINHCYPSCPAIADEWVIFNTAFMQRDVFESLGGFDCSFDVTCVGHADLAARCQFAGHNVIVHNIKLLQCLHMPATTGDHAPIHYAQLQKDIPNYIAKFNAPSFPIENVKSSNWKEQPPVWKRRFNETT